MSAPPWVILGLGNPGRRFVHTRHNVGFDCIDLLASECGIRLSERRPLAHLGTGRIDGVSVVLAKPRTYVNASGAAAHYLVQRFGIPAERLGVLMDDMDLPLGRLRIRHGGGSGGHNGLNSINEALGTSAYPRVRIGIARPEGGSIDHVLGRFDKAEREVINEALGRAIETVRTIVTEDVGAAMNRFN